MGDCWDHTAVAADSKLVVSLVVGKRTQAQTQQLVGDAKSRLRARHLPVLLSDGYAGYESAILETFGTRYPATGARGKGRARREVIRWPQGLAYGQVIKSAKGHCSEGIKLRVIRGKAHLQYTLKGLGYNKINTSTVERHNGTSRLHNQRKVRRTLAFSKATRYHHWMSWLSVVQYNFCRPHGSLRIQDEARTRHRTPAMAAGLTDHVLDTQDWLLKPVLGGQR